MFFFSPMSTMVAAAGAGGTGIVQFVGQTAYQFKDSTGAMTLDFSSLTGGIDTAAAEGDICFILWADCSASSGGETLASTGYTEIYNIFPNDTFDMRSGLLYKVQGATPDTTVSVTGHVQNGTNDSGECWGFVFRNIDTANPFGATTTTASAIDTSNANPPAITTTFDGALVASFISGATSDITSSYSDGGNTYDYFVQQSIPTSNRIGGHLALMFSEQLDSGVTVDYSTLTMSNSPFTQGSWVSGTVELRPGSNPQIIGTATGTNWSSNTGHTTSVDISSISLNSGDVILVFAGVSSSATHGISITGYTSIASVTADDNADSSSAALYKVSDGTETSVDVIIAANGTADPSSAARVYVLRGYDASSITSSTASGINTCLANPPSRTATSGNLVFHAGMPACNLSSITFANPGDWTVFDSIIGDSGTNELAAVLTTYETSTGAAINPSAVTCSGDSVGYCWTAIALDIAPA